MASYVIIGASRGLGYEWIRQLSQDKSNTVIGVVRTLESVQARLDSDKITNVTLLEGDMADNKSLEEAAAKTSDLTNGTLDYLIINGAHLAPATSYINPTDFKGKEELLKTEMLRSTEVNVLGNIYSINAFLPLIRKGAAKKIVSVSTGMADPDMVLKAAVPAAVVYASTKAAMNMVIVKYAIELKPEGISVLALSPGSVNTHETQPTEEEMKQFSGLFKVLQAAYPHWKGPITPGESVTHQRKVIEDLTLEQSGQFLSHWGNKEWL